MPADDRQFFIHLGQRIAELRKAQGFTQQQLADTLGIAQQTLAHYEGGRIRAPASILPTLARTLGVGVEDLIGAPQSAAARKRGPELKIQQHLERISALPKPRQRAVMDVIEALLAQQGR